MCPSPHLCGHPGDAHRPLGRGSQPPRSLQTQAGPWTCPKGVATFEKPFPFPHWHLHKCQEHPIGLWLESRGWLRANQGQEGAPGSTRESAWKEAEGSQPSRLASQGWGRAGLSCADPEAALQWQHIRRQASCLRPGVCGIPAPELEDTAALWQKQRAGAAGREV